MPSDPRDDRRDDRRDHDRDRDRVHSSSTKRRSASPVDRHQRHRDNDRDRDREHKRSRRDDDNDDDDRTRREHRKEKDRGRDKDKEHKKDRKPRETSTERAARKAERKAQKAADAALLLPQDARLAAAEVSFYSSTDNPFHDANLGDKFVWGKKREKERKSGMTQEEAKRRDIERHLESVKEIEALNLRRAQREADFALREEEAMRAARMAESAQMSAWIDREDDFHLEQAKKRAEIRVRERRAKPIDFLALNLKWSQPPLQPGDEGYDEQEEEEDDGMGLEVDMEEPYTIFDNLTLEDSEELHEDIKMYLSLEKSEANLEFWRSLLIVSSSSLEALRDERAIGITAYAAQTRASASVKAEITRLLSGKSYDQLVALQSQVQRKLTSGEPVDVEYWESLLKELIVWKAKGKLRDMHEIVLGNRLEQLRKKQRDEALKHKAEIRHALVKPTATLATLEEEGEGDGEEEEMEIEQEDEEVKAVEKEEWDVSLEPISFAKIPEPLKSCEIVEPGLAKQKLFAARRKIVQTRFVTKKSLVAATESTGEKKNAKDEEIYNAVTGQGMDEEEELFNLEVEMSKQAYSWEDKYRPRKPRYFNKVHTGYEWNKYNQTHYDSDNPPPKVVQGYRFNIFYPDLIDKTKAPQYRIVKDGNGETSTIIFSAGPPYEDVAFKVPDKPIEQSSKRGFRCSFDRGVLQLHYSYSRQFYRR